jgi:hypothetical protein
MNNMNLPLQGSLVGEIVKIDSVPEALRIQLNSDATVVTIQDLEGVNHPVWFSDNQVTEYGLNNILFVGNVVSADVEFRIEGVTEYENESGHVEPHTATSIAGRNVAHAATINLLMKGLNADFCKSLVDLRTKEAQKATSIGARGPNLKSIRVTDADGIPTMIERLKVKRESAPEAFKAQYDKKIAELELVLNPTGGTDNRTPQQKAADTKAANKAAADAKAAAKAAAEEAGEGN